VFTSPPTLAPFPMLSDPAALRSSPILAASPGFATPRVYEETFRPASAPDSMDALSSRVVTTARTSVVPVEAVDMPAVGYGQATLQDRLPRDAPVSDVAARIAVLTGLSDSQLGKLLKVQRETFCRWRTGTLDNPRSGSRRRLGLLLAVAEELSGADVSVKDWLLNQPAVDGLTPYQLLEQGRIDEVAYLASAVGSPDIVRDADIEAQREREPLVFGDDDVWDVDGSQDEEST